jgi:hypothetical protein
MIENIEKEVEENKINEHEAENEYNDQEVGSYDNSEDDNLESDDNEKTEQVSEDEDKKDIFISKSEHDQLQAKQRLSLKKKYERKLNNRFEQFKNEFKNEIYTNLLGAQPLPATNNVNTENVSDQYTPQPQQEARYNNYNSTPQINDEDFNEQLETVISKYNIKQQDPLLKKLKGFSREVLFEAAKNDEQVVENILILQKYHPLRAEEIKTLSPVEQLYEIGKLSGERAMKERTKKAVLTKATPQPSGLKEKGVAKKSKIPIYEDCSYLL